MFHQHALSLPRTHDGAFFLSVLAPARMPLCPHRVLLTHAATGLPRPARMPARRHLIRSLALHRRTQPPFSSRPQRKGGSALLPRDGTGPRDHGTTGPRDPWVTPAPTAKGERGAKAPQSPGGSRQHGGAYGTLRQVVSPAGRWFFSFNGRTCYGEPSNKGTRQIRVKMCA